MSLSVSTLYALITIENENLSAILLLDAVPSKSLSLSHSLSRLLSFCLFYFFFFSLYNNIRGPYSKPLHCLIYLPEPQPGLCID